MVQPFSIQAFHGQHLQPLAQHHLCIHALRGAQVQARGALVPFGGRGRCQGPRVTRRRHNGGSTRSVVAKTWKKPWQFRDGVDFTVIL